jgi:hypothetical protein
MTLSWSYTTTCSRIKMFVPPKHQPNKKPTKESTKESETKVSDEKEDSKWNVLDSCCFAPYKVLFAPVTKLAQVVSHKVK